MSKTDDGGSAFPLAFNSEGMSLRDWFAGMALQGMMGNGSIVDTFSAHAIIAKESYFLADEMLAARKEAANE